MDSFHSVSYIRGCVHFKTEGGLNTNSSSIQVYAMSVRTGSNYDFSQVGYRQTIDREVVRSCCHTIIVIPCILYMYIMCLYRVSVMLKHGNKTFWNSEEVDQVKCKSLAVT